MQNLGAIEVPILTITPLERGSNKKLTFTMYTNAENGEVFLMGTAVSILFELKSDKKTSTILKKATSNLSGGATDQIEVSSSTVFSLHLSSEDTLKLQDLVYWGLFTITDDTKIYKKYIQIPFI